MRWKMFSPVVALAAAVLSWPLPAVATPLTGELFYTRFSGFSRVEKVDVDFDGTVLTLGTPTTIGTGIGADGIAGNPNDSGSLLVGGQGNFVHRVSKSGGVIGSTGVAVRAFHLEVADSSTLYIADIPGTPGRVTLNPDGTLGASVALTHSGGPDSVVTQIITTPSSGFFYTRSGPGGFGNFGTIAFSGNSFTTSRLYGAGGTKSASTLPAAHGGVYDPFTDSIILFGDNHITQLDLAGSILSDLDLASLGLPFTLSNMDQGTVDGSGHVFAASNTGHLVFIDYTGGPKLVADASNFVAAPFLAGSLDDIAPLVGAGKTTDIPEPATLTLLGVGLAGLGFIRRRRRRTA